MVHLEREVLLAKLVQLVCLEDLVLRVPQVLLGRREHLVRKGLQVLLVVMVSRVLLVYPALLGLRVPLERMVTRERLESRVRKEAKLTKVNRVLQVQLVSKALLVLQVLLELMESLVPEVSRECLGRREMKVPEDSQDPQVPLVFRDSLDPRVRRERMEM